MALGTNLRSGPLSRQGVGMAGKTVKGSRARASHPACALCILSPIRNNLVGSGQLTFPLLPLSPILDYVTVEDITFPYFTLQI